MNESEMDNRGTKSEYFLWWPTQYNKISVKAQRVDGSRLFKNNLNNRLFLNNLRCTLMGYESNYQLISHSNQQKKYYSTYSIKKNNDIILNPWFVTGFTDAEGCFTIKLDKNAKRKVGWRVQACFEITLHKRDLILLQKIQYFLYFMWLR